MDGDASSAEVGKGPGRARGRGPGTAVVIGVCALTGLWVVCIVAVGWVFVVPGGTKDGPTCPGNVGQICLARSMYSEDWDGRFPPHQDWTDVLEPYLRDRRVYVCPQARNIPIGYAYRDSLDLRPVKEGGPPDKTIVFWDRQRQTELPAFRHNEGLYVGYVDGHVKWLEQEAFLQARSPRP